MNELQPTRRILRERIRAARQHAALTQSQMAADIGVSNVTVSRWETGETEPSTRNLVDMATRLDVSVDYLLGRTDNRRSHRDMSS